MIKNWIPDRFFGIRRRFFELRERFFAGLSVLFQSGRWWVENLARLAPCASNFAWCACVESQMTRIDVWVELGGGRRQTKRWLLLSHWLCGEPGRGGQGRWGEGQVFLENPGNMNLWNITVTGQLNTLKHHSVAIILTSDLARGSQVWILEVVSSKLKLWILTFT